MSSMQLRSDVKSTYRDGRDGRDEREGKGWGRDGKGTSTERQ
jgi:hypothetical protein